MQIKTMKGRTMTEEKSGQLEIEEGTAEQETASDGVQASADVEEPTSSQQPEGRNRTWIVAVAVIAAILALCTCVACLATGIALFSTDKDEMSGPPPAVAPTQAPSGTMVAITEPKQGQVVDISKPVAVEGTGAGLPEGNVIVEALDSQGNVLDRQPTTLKGKNAGTGAEGTWSAELTVKVEPGTAGRIWAYALSPKDGSTIAEDVIEVSLGRTAAVQAYVKIDEPTQGDIVDISKPVAVRGSGAGLPEGNVVVEALDAQGNLLAQQPTILQGQDVGSGGEGTWSIELSIKAKPGIAGIIRAFSPSPKDGSTIAEDAVEVSLGQTEAVKSYIKIDEPSPGATLDVSQPVLVSGTGAGLPEGNVVVVAADQNGDLLAEQPTTLQGADVGTGGKGTWSVELAVPASGHIPGYIGAFSTSPKQRDFVATDHVEVTFSGEFTLEGTTWLLDGTIPGSEITALFADGQVGGSAGCNSYKTAYTSTSTAGKNTLQVESPMAVTMMMCDEPLMDQEGLYLAALESATEYTIEGFSLSISYPGGTLLYFDQDGPRPRP
jgi:hypothetical protein